MVITWLWLVLGRLCSSMLMLRLQLLRTMQVSTVMVTRLRNMIGSYLVGAVRLGTSALGTVWGLGWCCDAVG